MYSANRGGTKNRQAHRGCRGRASFLRTTQRDRAIATARVRDRAIVAVPLGSARVSRAGERVLAIANFSSNASMFTPARIQKKIVLARRRRNAGEGAAGLSNQHARRVLYPDSRSRFNVTAPSRSNLV